MFGEICFILHNYCMQCFYLICLRNIYMLSKPPQLYYLNLVSQCNIIEIQKAMQPSL